MAKYMVDITLDSIEERIDKRDIIIKDKEADEIIDRFRNGIKELNHKFDLLQQGDDKLNVNEYILRSQIAFLMAYVDLYIHEIIKYSILKMFNGEKEKTKKYYQFTIYIETLERAINNPESIDWLEDIVISETKYKTYMKSKSIKDALDLISNKKIFRNTCKVLNMQQKDVEHKLDDIFIRRNEIVHQIDIDIITKKLNSIEMEFVKESIDFIEEFINTVHEYIVNDTL